MRKVTSAALIAVTAMVVIMSGVAAADDPSGPQTFLITTVQTPPEPAVRTITAYGVVSDAGTEEILDMHTLPDRSRLVHAQFVFPEGTLFVTEIFTLAFQRPVPPACEVTGAISGTFEITGGTGAFQGASGSGTLSGEGLNFLTFDPATDRCTGPAVLHVNERVLQGTVSVPGDSAAAS